MKPRVSFEGLKPRLPRDRVFDIFPPTFLFIFQLLAVFLMLLSNVLHIRDTLP